MLTWNRHRNACGDVIEQESKGSCFVLPRGLVFLDKRNMSMTDDRDHFDVKDTIFTPEVLAYITVRKLRSGSLALATADTCHY